MYFNTNQYCPPGTSPYTVKPGDTLVQIAERFGTTVPAIVSANPYINPNLIIVGQVLCIPRQTVYPPCPERNYYTVRSGDTLYKIAQTFSVSLDDLIEANPYLDPDNIRVGQIICIPLATPPVQCPEGSTPYIIRPGDTFYRIAQSFNVSLNALLELNPNINPDALLIGQRICIPVRQPIGPPTIPPTENE